MTLTFRSTISEQRVIIERNSRGDQRVARAVQGSNPKTWDLTVEHPSGTVRRGTFQGDGHTVNVALAQLLMDSENDFRQEAARGHRPAPATRDNSVRVDELGQNIAAPIKPIPRRG